MQEVNSWALDVIVLASEKVVNHINLLKYESEADFSVSYVARARDLVVMNITANLDELGKEKIDGMLAMGASEFLAIEFLRLAEAQMFNDILDIL